MKNIMDYFTTAIIWVIFMFTLCSFMVVEVQINAARHLHTQAIEMIQSSYYTVDIEDMNEKIQESFPDWEIRSETVSAVNNRQNRLVTLDYTVILPIFNIVQNGVIEGYAR